MKRPTHKISFYFIFIFLFLIRGSVILGIKNQDQTNSSKRSQEIFKNSKKHLNYGQVDKHVDFNIQGWDKISHFTPKDVNVPKNNIKGISASASWNSGGPYGGYINCIAISPSNPDFIYIGTITGVYKTLDGGGNWAGIGLSGDLKVNDVEIDPSNPNIVYAGVGEIWGSIGTEDGFYKSTDGGNTWTRKAYAEVSALAIDPNNPNILFFGTDNGEIYRSTNGGETWVLKHTETYSSTGVGINSIVVDPGDSSFVYAGTGGDFMHGGDYGFLKSTNGGDIWAGMHVGYLWADLGYSVVVTPKGYSPHTLYIISDGDVGYKDVYKSTDKGETWTELYMARFEPSFPYYYIDEPSTLAIDPLHPDYLYVGASYPGRPFRLYVSSEDYWYYAIGLPSSIPSCIAINPKDNAVLYIGFSDCPIYRSTDSGDSWNLSNKGINNADINDIATSPAYSDTAFAAINGFHLHKTSDGGASWTELNGTSGDSADVEAVAVNPNNPSILLIGTESGWLYRSTDGGISWNDVALKAFFPRKIKDIWINPSDPNIVLVAAEEEDIPGYETYYGGVFRNTYGGSTLQWNFTYEFWRPTCLASDPTNHQNVYLGTRDNGYVIKSSNAGVTWKNIGPSSGSVDTVYDIVVDSDSKVYAATDNGLWIYDGARWTKLSGLTTDDVITALAIDRSTDPGTIYIGTKEEGVFISQDGGSTWSSFSEGLGNFDITELSLSESIPRLLYAGTSYGGLWVRSISGFTLTIAVGTGGTTSPSPGTHNYEEGALVNVSAIPDSGYNFLFWSGDVPAGHENDNPLSLTMDGNKSITANFISIKGKDSLVGTWSGQGVYYRDSDDGTWVKMATPATQVTVGDLDNDGIDDLIGIWPAQGGVWVKYSANGSWSRLSSTADWIGSGDMNGDGRDDLIGTWSGQGVFYKDSNTGSWVKMATPATQIAAGDLDGDGTDDLLGIWPGQGGVWVKYSSSVTWQRLSSTADWIACGKMTSASSSSPEIALASPVGGIAVGPTLTEEHEDFSTYGPGGTNFKYLEEKNLSPRMKDYANIMRIPGPGESGFKCAEQKNLLPQRKTKI